MSYKPNEHDLMAYLYDELAGPERDKVEQYLMENPEAKSEFEKLAGVSGLLKTIKDKEVIAPPIFVGEHRTSRFWDAPYFKTVVSVAASLIIVILVARFSGINVTVTGNEMRLGFGAPAKVVEPAIAPEVSPEQVQRMIDQSLQANNAVLSSTWQQSQKELAASISKNLVVNSDKMDQVVREASSASKEQIQEYVSTLQAENMKLVKDYFTLTSGEQKQYIEGLLVDFAKYLQQQRNDDLRLVQTRLNSIEQNNTVFKQETEQILTSIITTVGNPAPTETKY
jgi:hypothetical protein